MFWVVDAPLVFRLVDSALTDALSHITPDILASRHVSHFSARGKLIVVIRLFAKRPEYPSSIPLSEHCIPKREVSAQRQKFLHDGRSQFGGNDDVFLFINRPAGIRIEQKSEERSKHICAESLSIFPKLGPLTSDGGTARLESCTNIRRGQNTGVRHLFRRPAYL